MVRFVPQCLLKRRLMDRVIDVSRVSDLFPDGSGEDMVREMKAWLTEKKVRDLEPVSLFTEQLEKVSETQ